MGDYVKKRFRALIPCEHDEGPVALAGRFVLWKLDAIQVVLLVVAFEHRHRLGVVERALERQVVNLREQ